MTGLASDDGVFEIPGAQPVWIWAHTCPEPECPCRSALILATNEGRDVLLERGSAVRDAWISGEGYAEIASNISNLVNFSIDIDTVEAYRTIGEERIDISNDSRIGDIVERIDGEVLEALGRLWYRGKHLTDPEQEALAAEQIELKDWRPGDMVAWDDLCTGVRRDIYIVDGRHYEAHELYCPSAKCGCGEVVVDFEALFPAGLSDPGGIIVQPLEPVEFRPARGGRARLEKLWTEFRRRHPQYPARFAGRYPALRSIGARLLPQSRPAVAPKIGRNDPCPCGSGKKYKKCCGSSSDGARH